jgi:hypothetical protein
MSRPLSVLLVATVLATLVVSGCTGYGPGPDPRDAVTVRYDLHYAGNGTLIRSNLTETFVVGDQSSMFGKPVDDEIMQRRLGESFEVDLAGYGETVHVNRSLAAIPVFQSAPRADFEQFVGAASVNQTFPAYGIYDGVVTEVTNDTVFFRILAIDGQEDPVPSVGATLVTTIGETDLLRDLRPNVGQTFVISPPSPYQPSTPLGLDPGAYIVRGASDTQLEYGRSPLGDPALFNDPKIVGKDLVVEVQILAIQPEPEPSGNYGVRSPRTADPLLTGEPIPGSSAAHTH